MLKAIWFATLILLSQTELARAVNGFFRVALQVLVQEAADPIRSPGSRSGHSHTIAGPSNFGLTLDYDTLVASTCTTSPVAQDKSGYWTPMVFLLIIFHLLELISGLAAGLLSSQRR